MISFDFLRVCNRVRLHSSRFAGSRALRSRRRWNPTELFILADHVDTRPDSGPVVSTNRIVLSRSREDHERNLEAIKFNHDPTSATADAFNI
jgi:hypothetical protein